MHNYVNLAIAVDLDFEGLLAPVIHEADDKRLRAIARDIHDLATRARTKKLSADDITGGTFTISNSGPFGTFMVIPVINQPQVAILSTDGVTRKPVVVDRPRRHRGHRHPLGRHAGHELGSPGLRRRLRRHLPARGQVDPRDAGLGGRDLVTLRTRWLGTVRYRDALRPAARTVRCAHPQRAGRRLAAAARAPAHLHHGRAGRSGPRARGPGRRRCRARAGGPRGRRHLPRTRPARRLSDPLAGRQARRRDGRHRRLRAVGRAAAHRRPGRPRSSGCIPPRRPPGRVGRRARGPSPQDRRHRRAAHAWPLDARLRAQRVP